MRLADQMLLAQIREALLGNIPDQQWALVEQEVEKAGGVDKVDGYTGVLLRDAIEKAKKNKVETVMSEFKAGKLKSSSGKKVKSRKQAIAIALSEQRRVKKEMLEKASFGGDRSAAGRYAAEQRWKGHAKSDKPSGNNRARIAALADIEANQAQINKLYQEQARLGIGDEKRMEQIGNVISRLEQLDRNLRSKYEQAGYGTSPRLATDGKVDVKSDKPSGDEEVYDTKRDKAIYQKLFGAKKPLAVDSRAAKPARDQVDRIKDEIREVGEKGSWRGITKQDAQRDLEDNIKALGNIDTTKRGALQQRRDILSQIARARGIIAALEEIEDETSPGYLAS